MRRKAPVIFILFAVVLAVVAALGAHRWINNQAQRAAAAKVVTAPVVVAAMDLAAGTTLKAVHLRSQEWPRNSLPAGYYARSDKLVGRTVRRPLVRGEAILAPKLAQEGLKGGLSSVVPSGFRAMTVRVDEVIGVAGFVQARDSVDVLVTVSRGTYRDNPITRTVLQDVLVLAVGEKVQEDKTGKGPRRKKVTVVTLQLKPEMGERLALAATEGKILLALRNQGDRGGAETSGVRLTALMPSPPPPPEEVEVVELPPPAPPQPPPPPPKKVVRRPEVEIIKGTARSTQSL